MMMTNYMDLLAANQPWNLLLFMVIPVGLAEALVATEFYMVYLKDKEESGWRRWNRRLGIAAGVYFTGVVLYLVTHVVPFLEWRGVADMAAILLPASIYAPHSLCEIFGNHRQLQKQNVRTNVFQGIQPGTHAQGLTD